MRAKTLFAIAIAAMAQAGMPHEDVFGPDVLPMPEPPEPAPPPQVNAYTGTNRKQRRVEAARKRRCS